MKRSNTFDVVPRSPKGEELLRRVLDAAASLWNELTYERRQRFFGKLDGSVWDALRVHDHYNGVLGSAAAKEMKRKNDEAWRSFFSLKEKDEHCSPPGYWGNEEDGRKLRWYGRCDQYTLETGDRSRLEIPIGKDLKDEYDLSGRLRLEVHGRPKWDGKNGRLELYYDDLADKCRAIQPVTTDSSRQDSPLADNAAALDIGANNIVACTTTSGQQYLYTGRDLFAQFRDTTREIARLQSLLEDGRYSSHRIRRVYRRRTRRRDHAMDALVRDLLERLYEDGVSTVYVGALTDVLSTHWSVEANAKTHNFWAFRAFIDRLETTAEEYSIDIKERSEAWTSRECPQCGSTERTTRHQDTLTCPCGFEGHADLTASETFLKRQTTIARPMARPVCLKWNDHTWSAISHAHESSNEEHTNRDRSHEREVASVGGLHDRPPARGIPRL